MPTNADHEVFSSNLKEGTVERFLARIDDPEKENWKFGAMTLR